MNVDLRRGAARIRAAVADQSAGRRGLRSAAPGVLCAAALAVLLRVPFIGRAAFPDESGLLMVARRWESNGTALYGDLWIDRPPLLLLFWRLADMLGGVEAARWLGCLLVVSLVISAGWAGWLIGARVGAQWAAFTAAALVSTPLLATHEINGELIAAPLVMASCALTLTVFYRSPSIPLQATIAAAAGFTGMCALLVKQNFVDALVFAAVLLVVAWIRQELTWMRVRRIIGYGTVGAFIPAGVTAWWTLNSGHTLGDLWYALYGFRSDAMHAIATQSLSAPTDRLVRLIGVGLISGVVLVGLRYLTRVRTLLRTDAALTSAITAMLVVGTIAILAGGSFWLHYLIGVIPALALVGAHLGARTSQQWPSRAAIGVVIVSAVVTPVVSVTTGALADDSTETTVKEYLREAKDHRDTAVVGYGHANVIEAAGLDPGYRYLWSLPMRVLDPDLDRLVGRLAGSDAPTWYVQWEPVNSWNIDRNGDLGSAVRKHYREVASVCEVTIHLHEGETRQLPSPPDPVDCRD